MKRPIKEPPAFYLEMELQHAILKYNLELAGKADRKEITHEEYLRLKFPEVACDFIDEEMDKAVEKWDLLGASHAN